MKFIELDDGEGEILLNPKQIVVVSAYDYTHNGEPREGTKIYCTDGDTNPFCIHMDYDTVKKLLEGAEE